MFNNRPMEPCPIVERLGALLMERMFTNMNALSFTGYYKSPFGPVFPHISGVAEIAKLLMKK